MNLPASSCVEDPDIAVFIGLDLQHHVFTRLVSAVRSIDGGNDRECAAFGRLDLDHRLLPDIEVFNVGILC